MNKVNPRNSETISVRLDDIRNRVREMIANGELKPGDRVNEQALATQLGVGRNSAREALRSLERTGLVHIVPNRGAEVRKISLEEALDLYDVRAGLAHVSGRLIASRLEVEEEALLIKLMEDMDSAMQRRDSAAYYDLNQAFHKHLMAATKNPRLIEANDGIEAELTLYIRQGVYTIAQMRNSHEEHQRIMEALRNGQAKEAADAFEEHVLIGKQRMLDTVARQAPNHYEHTP